MPRLLEPEVKGRFDVDTGEYRLKYSQRIDQTKRQTKYRRDKSDALGINTEGMISAASVPMVTYLKIKEDHHIDLMTCGHDDRMRALRIIQRDYPLLLNTNKRFA